METTQHKEEDIVEGDIVVDPDTGDIKPADEAEKPKPKKKRRKRKKKKAEAPVPESKVTQPITPRAKLSTGRRPPRG